MDSIESICVYLVFELSFNETHCGLGLADRKFDKTLLAISFSNGSHHMSKNKW